MDIARKWVDLCRRGRNAGAQRMTMDEVGRYPVKSGRIVREEFYYSMGG